MGNEKLSEYIQFRLTPYEKNRIRGLAKLYADGDMSLWLRWAGLNAERKHLIFTNKKTPVPAKALRSKRK
jgi:hypothetical protein